MSKETDPPASANVGLFDQLGEAVVKLVVGKGKTGRTFVVHRKKLADKIPYFEKMFNGSFKEGKEQAATFPEDDPDAFSLLLGWVYLDSIEHFTSLSNSGCHITDIPRYFRLYALAEKCNVVELADKTMDYLVTQMSLTRAMPTTYHMKLGYESTPAKSKLRILSARSLAYLTSALSHDQADGIWSSDKLYSVMVEVPDLGRDSVALFRNKSGKPAEDPRKAPLCDYHFHAATEPCPYKTK